MTAPQDARDGTIFEDATYKQPASQEQISSYMHLTHQEAESCLRFDKEGRHLSFLYCLYGVAHLASFSFPQFSGILMRFTEICFSVRRWCCRSSYC